LASETLEQVHDAGQLQRLWSQLDVQDRRDPQVIAAACARAAALGAESDALQWLRPLWDQLPDLSPEDKRAAAQALVDVRRGIGVDWLPRVESAAQVPGQEVAVLAAAGLVMAERQLWGKAKPLLAAAAAAHTLPAPLRRLSLLELAHIAHNQGDGDRARELEQTAAALP
jgi:HemY protein